MQHLVPVCKLRMYVTTLEMSNSDAWVRTSGLVAWTLAFGSPHRFLIHLLSFSVAQSAGLGQGGALPHPYRCSPPLALWSCRYWASWERYRTMWPSFLSVITNGYVMRLCRLGWLFLFSRGVYVQCIWPSISVVYLCYVLSAILPWHGGRGMHSTTS